MSLSFPCFPAPSDNVALGAKAQKSAEDTKKTLVNESKGSY